MKRKNKQAITIKKKREMFIKLYEKNLCNISISCKKLGISRETFYAWLHKDSNFKKSIEALNEGMIDFAESKLMVNIKDGKETSLIFFLKTKGKSRGYIERQEVDVNNLNSIKIEFEKEV